MKRTRAVRKRVRRTPCCSGASARLLATRVWPSTTSLVRALQLVVSLNIFDCDALMHFPAKILALNCITDARLVFQAPGATGLVLTPSSTPTGPTSLTTIISSPTVTSKTSTMPSRWPMTLWALQGFSMLRVNVF